MNDEVNPNTPKRTKSAQLVLVLVNLGFFVGGVLLIAYAVKFRNSAFILVFEVNLPWIKSVIQGCMISLGSVVIILSLAGFWGAFFKKRGILHCYNFFVALAFVLFITVMVCAFVSMATANKWAGDNYPAENKEPLVADGFNTVYCYSEAVYLCNFVPVKDLAGALFPGILDVVTSEMQGLRGINALCDKAKPFLKLDIISNNFESLLTACDECGKTKQYDIYQPVFEWVDAQCPLIGADIEPIVWCGGFLFEGAKGDEFEGAPYGTCRPQFLNFWSSTSKILGLVFVGVAGFLLVVIFSVCLVNRRPRQVEEVAEKRRTTNNDGHDTEQPEQNNPSSASAVVY